MFCSVLCLLCFVRVCLYVLRGHLLGKGWPLGSRLWCLLWVCHFPIGILGQVWYLIVSIPDLCNLTYFDWILKPYKQNYLGPICLVLSAFGKLILSFTQIWILLSLKKYWPSFWKPNLNKVACSACHRHSGASSMDCIHTEVNVTYLRSTHFCKWISNVVTCSNKWLAFPKKRKSRYILGYTMKSWKRK